ncbi:MAG: phosphopyruvate hydratase, partial [Candidatus Omnitrophica bacterium]|nr:phosphopyruvate hydratase [Candidatus Omnitrophota bacterium]
MVKITVKNIQAREILDSRGNPTVEVDCLLSDGAFGRAAVPSGASTGEHEAVELRDGDKKRYLGKGVLNAVSHVNGELAKALKGKDPFKQQKADEAMCRLDGTENKKRLGANAILGVSLSLAKAAAQSKKRPLYSYVRDLMARPKPPLLPVPMMNILNGGLHADNNVDLQEFMIMPFGGKNFSEALRIGAEVFHHLKKILHDRKLSTAVGDEGGFAPNVGSNAEAIEVILEAVEKAGYRPGEDVKIALDPASSSFYEEGAYWLEAEKEPKKSAGDMVDFYARWLEKYPIFSIEDGLA